MSMEEAKAIQSNVVKAVANYTKQTYDLVDIEHGLNDDGDYIWHFSNHHRARQFPKDLVYIIRVIKTFLDQIIPEDIKVDVFLPPSDWEIKVITIKAVGIGKKWSFSEDDMVKHLPEIGSLISEELNRLHRKR